MGYSGLGFRSFLLYFILTLFVLYVTRVNNMWGVNKGSRRAKEDVRTAEKLKVSRLKWLKYLSYFRWASTNVGFSPTEGEIKDIEYKIARLRMKIKVLERNWTAFELLGLFRILSLGGFILGITLTVLTRSPIFLMLMITMFVKLFFNGYASSQIGDEDRELEKNFPDLFLILYSRLQRGAHIRLAPTLDNFLTAHESIYGKKEKVEIYNFVSDIRNNIEIYGDDSMAVRKMKDMYRSAMVINFCNLAVQSLNGVNNNDKLLAFKIELAQKRLKQMEEIAEQRREKGKRAIWLIYVILFQFVALSWIAKLGGSSGLGGMLGF